MIQETRYRYERQGIGTGNKVQGLGIGGKVGTGDKGIGDYRAIGTGNYRKQSR